MLCACCQTIRNNGWCTPCSEHTGSRVLDVSTATKPFRGSYPRQLQGYLDRDFHCQLDSAWLSSEEIQLQPWALSSLVFFSLHSSCAYATSIWQRDKQNDSTPQLVLLTGNRVRGRKEEEKERGGWRKGGEENKREGRKQEKRKETNQPTNQACHLD